MKRYHVTAFDDQKITLKMPGFHLGGGLLVVPRSQIATVSSKISVLVVATADGRRFEVLRGVRAEQRELTRQAFGM